MYQIPPGYRLDYESGIVSLGPYWNPYAESLVESLSLEDAAALALNELELIVKSALLGRRSACLISGGLDSGVIAAMASKIAKETGGQTSLLTLGPGVDSVEERFLQKKLARDLAVELVVSRRVAPRLQLEPLRALNRKMDAPAGGLFTGAYSQLMEEAVEHEFEVLFTGEGGDELFACTPLIIADLIGRGRLLAAVQALAFFASSDTSYTTHGLIWRFGMVPLIVSACGARFPAKLLGAPVEAELGFLTEFFGDFAGSVLAAYRSLAEESQREAESGASFSAHSCYQQIVEIPFYEAVWPYQHVGPQVVSPLVHLQVLRAAMALRLTDRVGTWVGYRPKEILKLIGQRIVSTAVWDHPKIGVSNLLARMTADMEGELVAELLSPGFEELGIQPSQRLLDPRNVPTGVSLYWSLFLTLKIWYEELRHGAAARKQTLG
ncbi:MAG TPA: asparagine synthase-related protein [Thermoanaerobaculia bacterium]|nr:asparagine synthase-related protein [Thermoanaerobaculia bacterium]